MGSLDIHKLKNKKNYNVSVLTRKENYNSNPEPGTIVHT